LFAFLFCAVVVLSGCAERKRPRIPWATATKVKPIARPAAATSAFTDAPPDLQMELPPFPSHLTNVRPSPPRPRVSTPSASANGNDAEKLSTPNIAPQLSAGESAAAQQETNQNLNIAESNLKSAAGKKLNPAQLDLVSKIKGFVKDAREAAQNTEWGLARSLSKKARLLSEDLAGSL
jgi:hypothetical protein